MTILLIWLAGSAVIFTFEAILRYRAKRIETFIATHKDIPSNIDFIRYSMRHFYKPLEKCVPYGKIESPYQGVVKGPYNGSFESTSGPN